MVKSEDSNTGKLIPVKHLKRSRRFEGAAAPPMMIEKVMIQTGVHFKSLPKIKKVAHDVRRSDDSNRGAMIQERV